MDYLQAFILAVVQGVTEWLPVSSSGHLVLLQSVLGVDAPVSFDVTLHLGTLVAVVYYMRADIVRMFRSVLSNGFGSEDGRLVSYIALGTLPAAAAGILFLSYFESLFKSVSAVAGGLLFTGLLLYISGMNAKAGRLNAWKSLLVGVMQAVSIVPGVSRSGSTISTGLMLGVRRGDSVRFSFLLSIPAILGATVVEAKGLIASQIDPALLAFSFAVSAVVGYFSIRLLWKVVGAGRFHLFAYYCWFVGFIVLFSRI